MPNLFFSTTLILIAFSSASVAAVNDTETHTDDTSATCVLDTLSRSLADLSPGMNQVLQCVRELDPTLVSMEKAPEWQDLENLKKAIETLKSAKADLASQGRLEEARKWAAEAEKSLQADPKLSAITSQVQSTKLTNVYNPFERALKRLYVKLLYTLDRELPSNLRIPFKHNPFDLRPPKLIADARKLVADQENRLDDLTRGSAFPDDTSFRLALNSMGGTYKDLLKALDDGRYEFAMRHPENTRWWVPKVGFLNQFTTVSSGGRVDPKMRNEFEAKMIGKKLSIYKNFDNDLKPKYGYLKPTPDFGLKQSDKTSLYGNDVYVFKKDRVKDRVTWTAGDSFTYLRSSGWDPENPVPMDWQSSFIPWRNRSRIVPFIQPRVESVGKVGFEAGYVKPDQADLPQDVDESVPLWRFKNTPLEPFKFREAVGYLEVQYFGPLTLDDVEIFEFHETPPSGEFLEELKKRKIKIRDGRKDPAVEWKEGTP